MEGAGGGSEQQPRTPDPVHAPGVAGAPGVPGVPGANEQASERWLFPCKNQNRCKKKYVLLAISFWYPP